jgi:thiamine-monophosphate kinase
MKVIAITAVGTVEKAITRSGAKAGESIYLSTLPGWSAAGLLMVSKESSDDLEAYAIEEFCAPSVDYSMAQSMAMAGATSMCDISDALVIQAEQIARASGVHLAFKQKLFEVHPEFVALIELAIKHDIDVWQWICAGGEDHVFLATGKDLPGLCVGVVMEGSGVSGLEMKKAPDTWRHFN